MSIDVSATSIAFHTLQQPAATISASLGLHSVIAASHVVAQPESLAAASTSGSCSARAWVDAPGQHRDVHESCKARTRRAMGAGPAIADLAITTCLRHPE
jgi:hypothetical protein